MTRHVATATRANSVTITISSIAVAGKKCGCHARPNTIPTSRPRSPKHDAQAATARPGSESMRRIVQSPVNSTQRGVDCLTMGAGTYGASWMEALIVNIRPLANLEDTAPPALLQYRSTPTRRPMSL